MDTLDKQDNQYSMANARLYKIALLVGFLSLIVGLIAAHTAPANGYEVSIYWATPMLYWIGAGSAFLISLIVLSVDCRSRLAPLAMLLSGTSVASFLGLQIIRNYYFQGYQDPLTHLGEIRALAGGWIDYFQPIYPGSYSVTVFITSLTGMSTNRAMIYVMFIFALLFLIFIPLTIKSLISDRRAVVIGMFSAFLLLPINNISLLYRFHPFSINTLFFPVVIYLFVKHITKTPTDSWLPKNLDASSFLLPVALFSVLLLHPQMTVDVIIILGVAAVSQLYFHRYRPNHALATHQTIYGSFVFLVALFVFWTLNHPTASQSVSILINDIMGFLTGTTEVAGTVQQRSGSASSIGVSIYELFIKYFLASSIYSLFSLLTVGLGIAKIIGWTRKTTVDEAENNLNTLTYFMFGGLSLIPYILIHSVGKSDTYVFRHLGFGMVFVTLFGAVGLYCAVTHIESRFDDYQPLATSVFAILAIVVLVLSLLSVYASPFLFLPGQHVSSYQMNGYTTSFEAQPEDRSVWFGGIRHSSNRYEDALFAAPNVTWDGSPRARSSGPVANENLTRLRPHYENHREPVTQRDHYFTVSRVDYQRELVAYKGLRYSRASIDSISESAGVHNIYSNGNYRLYYVDTTGTPMTQNAQNAT